MQKPFFSVVIPTLNEEKYLPNLLSDLNAQTFKDFEVWIVDGKSDDKTEAIVKKYIKTHPNTHLLISDQRHVSVQRNLGAKKSDSEYLFFSDADSRIPEYFLEGVHYQLIRKPVDMWTNYTDPETDDAKDKLMSSLLNIFMEAGASTSYPVAVGANVGCKRSVFEIVGGFDESVSVAEDLLFGHAIVEHHFKTAVYKEPRYQFCMRRMRKDGYISMSARMVPLVIKTLQGKKFNEPVDDYPMLGGGYFEKHKEDPKIKPSIVKYYQRLRSTIRKREKLLKLQIKDAFGDM